MTHSASGCCTNENLCHVAKGTGYFFGATGATLAIFVVAAVVTAVALGLLVWDGLFVYSVGLQAPLHLLWAIPVTIAFMAIDMLIIANVARVGAVIGFALGWSAKNCGDKMLDHYRAVNLCPPSPEIT